MTIAEACEVRSASEVKSVAFILKQTSKVL